MKKAAMFLCAVALLSGSSLAAVNEESYKSEATALIEKTERLDTFLKVRPLDFAAYDNWYKQFRSMHSHFQRTFAATHTRRGSFQAISEGVELLSQAWGMLNQAKYAEDQYKESITLEQVSYAHKWKESAAEQQNSAYNAIVDSLNCFKRARNLLKEEKPEDPS